ncbi:MAG: hypothetical protein Sapg2KO_15160 [Saprospiraceae bacterium]
MKKLALLFCTLLFALTVQLSAQSTQERNVDSFDEIQVSAGIDLFLKQGGSPSVKVKATEKIIDDIATYVENGKLIIKMKSKNYRNWGRDKKEVYIVVDNLKALTASGGSDIFSEGLDLDELAIRASGGSDVSLNIKVDDLSLTLSGGSDVDIKGSAENMEVRASGGSDLNAGKLEVKDCKITTSGASDANIYVTGNLSMSASGASDINYSGRPNVVSSRSSGGADINGN